MDIPAEITPSLVGVVVLAGVTTFVLVLFQVPRQWEPVIAIARGAVQLAVISVILSGIVASPGWIAVALGRVDQEVPLLGG